MSAQASMHPYGYHTHEDYPAQADIRVHTHSQTPFSAEIGQVAIPEPIQALRDNGQMTAEEDALARRFYYEVHQSNLLPQLSGRAGPQINPCNPQMQEIDNHVKGIFSLLNSVDEQLLGTICALLLEMKISGYDHPLPVEEVGRRIMGYSSQEANAAAGATLLRAALWIVRFGYQHPRLCQVLLREKKHVIEQNGRPAGW